VTARRRGGPPRCPDEPRRLIEYGLVSWSKPSAVVAVISIALLTAGCGERQEPTGAVSVDYPVTVRGAGSEPLTLQEEPSRVVALDPGSAEIVSALGAGDTLVGAPASASVDGKQPANIAPEAGQIDVETVVSLHPDLVIATLENNQVDVAQVARQTGAPLYAQPSATVDDIVRAVIELGFLLGHPAEARKLAGDIRTNVGEIEDRLADVGRVSAFVDTGLFVTIPKRSIFSDLLRRAKGVNVAPDPSQGPITAEELASRNPTVYLATSDSGVTLEELQRNPDTKDLTAVRDGRFVILPVELVSEPGPDVAEALQAIAVALHPDAFR
jgi:cobalamin transport system substrate-binding protein